MIIDLFMAHLVGDYLLQDDWQAQNKKAPGSKGLLACLVHCVLYTAAVFAFAFTFGGRQLPIWAIGAVFLSHWALDRYKIMPVLFRFMRKNKFGQPPMAPWSFILVDNILHVLVLYAITQMI